MNTEQPTPATTPTSPSDIRSVAVRCMEMMADGDRATFEELVHPDAVNHESRTEPPATRVTGPEGFHATALWLRGAFAELHHDILHAVAADDLVVLDTVMTGRQVGTFVTYTEHGRVDQAFVPTGRTFSVRQSHWLRIHDGRMIEHWAVRDDLGMARQAGWIPPTPVGLIRNALAKRRARKTPAAGTASHSHENSAGAPLKPL